MKSQINDQIYSNLKTTLSQDDRRIATQIARSKGMTFSGWITKTLREQIEKEVSNDSRT